MDNELVERGFYFLSIFWCATIRAVMRSSALPGGLLHNHHFYHYAADAFWPAFWSLYQTKVGIGTHGLAQIRVGKPESWRGR